MKTLKIYPFGQLDIFHVGSKGCASHVNSQCYQLLIF